MAWRKVSLLFVAASCIGFLLQTNRIPSDVSISKFAEPTLPQNISVVGLVHKTVAEKRASAFQFQVGRETWINEKAIDGKDRRPSFPFITGDGFRRLCKHRGERVGRDRRLCNFRASDVQSGECVYIAVTDLKTFRTTSRYLHAFDRDIRLRIKKKYILVSHNGDLSAPYGDSWHPNEKNPGEWKENFLSWLESPMLIRWYASNCHFKGNVKPEKLRCIPIGLRNRYNKGGKLEAKDYPMLKTGSFPRPKRKRLPTKLLVDFVKDNHWKPDRGKALDSLGRLSFIKRTRKMSAKKWRDTVRTTVFVSCPHGHGLDTHRLWEVLLLGSYPVVKSSTLDSMYTEHGLPVLIVKEWSDVTIELLNTVRDQFSKAPYVGKSFANKLTFSYWKEIIEKDAAENGQ